MEVAEIKEQLLHYIDNSNERLLTKMLDLAKEYDEHDDVDYEFTAEDIKELDELRAKRLSGESKTYTWEEAKKMITRRS